jgi:hypothetical protein
MHSIVCFFQGGLLIELKFQSAHLSRVLRFEDIMVGVKFFVAIL